jgi:beta-lactamase regulating signal transducer with metallopeptidase domain
MDTLLQVGISNAVAAVALALVAGTASLLWRRRPALVHGLWLLVLLKLLTPPLVRVPVPVMSEGSAPTAAAAVSPRFDLPASSAWPSDHARAPEQMEIPTVAAAGVGDRRPDVATDAVPVSADPIQTLPAAEAALPAPAFPMPDWQTTLPVLWVAGTVAWFLLAGVRLARFARLLRHAKPAPDEVQNEADRMATALGMRWCPAVQLLPGRLAPMVWAGLGTPKLLLPAGLLDQLDEDAVSTLIAHELAHLRRGDHRVRLVEFLAVGLFWWHPVVWVARRALREAEEQCCDAWVVSALPGASKTYATAILETLDFLSAAPAAPPLACGIGHVSDLKRRLTMIMRGATPRALCWREGLAVLGLAALLPLLPTLARAERDDATPPATSARTANKKVIVFRTGEDSEEGDKAKKIADVDKAKAELKALEAELQKKVAEVREASMRLKEAAEKIHRVEIEKAKEMARTMAKDMAKDVQEKVRDIQERIRKEIHVQVDGQEMKGRKMIIDGPIEIEITADGHTLVRKIEARRARGSAPTPPAPPAPPAAATPTAPATPAEPARARGEAGSRRSERRDDDGRIDQLERKLESVLRELESLRKEKGDSMKKDKDKEKNELQRRERRPSRNRSDDETAL